MIRVNIPKNLSFNELMRLISSIEDAFGVELAQVCPDHALFEKLEGDESC